MGAHRYPPKVHVLCRPLCHNSLSFSRFSKASRESYSGLKPAPGLFFAYTTMSGCKLSYAIRLATTTFASKPQPLPSDCHLTPLTCLQDEHRQSPGKQVQNLASWLPWMVLPIFCPAYRQLTWLQRSDQVSYLASLSFRPDFLPSQPPCLELKTGRCDRPGPIRIIAPPTNSTEAYHRKCLFSAVPVVKAERGPIWASCLRTGLFSLGRPRLVA